MYRSEQLKILLDHKNTEHIIVDEEHELDLKVDFEVDYDIGSLEWLINHGDSLKAYFLPGDVEPHAVCLYAVDGRKCFYVKIRTAPMYKWIVGRKDLYCEGALRYAAWIDPYVLDAPVDGALLLQEVVKYVENYCENHNLPFRYNGTTFYSTVCSFKYNRLQSEIIGSSKTPDYTHVWCVAPETPFNNS